ncbi:MAG TPA: DUF3617 family protein [Dissulfurispiraceae bacterium]|nr:DUF3617 family protein [Dissulfurispiraceae bacterium]
MKRSAFFAVAASMLIGVFFVAGCGQKQEPSAPSAPAKPAAAINMQEGQWEITTTVDMPGMPAGAMKPHTFTACLSPKEAVPKGQEQTDCVMKDMNYSGNTVTWTTVCKDATSKGSITYAGASYDGVMETTMKMEGKDMTTKMTMKGKHIGPCPQK